MIYANLIGGWPTGWQVVFWIAYWTVALLFIWKVGVPFARWYMKSWKRVLGMWVFWTVASVLQLGWGSQPRWISLAELLWFGFFAILTVLTEWHPRRAARAALKRHYEVPYEHELTDVEKVGMEKLEEDGVVKKDVDGWHVHWHREREA